VLVRSSLLVLTATLLIAGCSDPAPAPVVAPSETVASSPDGVPSDEDPTGATACSLLKAAVNDATLMEPGVADAIAQAGSEADAPIADAGQRLATAYAAAVTARGKDTEPDAVAAVSAAGADMTSVCTESGLDTVG